MSNVLKGYDEFLKLRQEVMDALAKVTMDCVHKSYEGTFELTFSYPSFFDDGYDKDEPDAVIIQLYCYVLGPSRHYEWRGKDILSAVENCREDVRQWIKDELGDRDSDDDDWDDDD